MLSSSNYGKTFSYNSKIPKIYFYVFSVRNEWKLYQNRRRKLKMRKRRLSFESIIILMLSQVFTEKEHLMKLMLDLLPVNI